MSTKVIAIAGAGGYVGKAVTSSLLDLAAFEVRILTRESSIESAPLQEFKKRGASLYAVSYDDEASLIKALKGVDVVLSTVGVGALDSAQVPLVYAAKKAGVKTFFPSEYGGDFAEDNPSPWLQAKRSVLKAAKEVDLPLTVVITGGFPEFCLAPHLGYEFAKKKMTIWGDGEAKSTWTTVRSVGEWVANVLKTVPIEQLQNKEFRIQGDLASPNEVVKLWESKHKDKLQVEYRTPKELEDRIEANNQDFLAILLKEWESGRGALAEPLSNNLYPGWKPDSVESIL